MEMERTHFFTDLLTTWTVGTLLWLCAAKLIFPHFSSSGFYWAIKRGLSEQQRSSGPPVLNLSFKNLFSVADLYPGPTLEGKFVFFGGFVCLQTFCGKGVKAWKTWVESEVGGGSGDDEAGALWAHFSTSPELLGCFGQYIHVTVHNTVYIGSARRLIFSNRSLRVQ